MKKDKTIRSLVQMIRSELREIYPENEVSSLIRIIFRSVTPYDQAHHLHLNQDETLDIEHYHQIKDITKQLKSGKPVQQILGETEFYSLTFRLSPQVLIPRQETEELVDWMIHETRNKGVNILDIGTGSGCIAVALAKNLEQATVEAIDLDAGIVDLARENARINQVSIRVMKGDILKDKNIGSLYDVIVSNPPYVRELEKKWMHPNVLDYEPDKALFVPDDDPLLFYRHILEYANKHLRSKGKLYFEINEALGKEMITLVEDFGYRNIHLKKDLNGKDRMIKAQKP